MHAWRCFHKPRISRLASGLLQLNAVCSPTPGFPPSSFFVLLFIPLIFCLLHTRHVFIQKSSTEGKCQRWHETAFAVTSTYSPVSTSSYLILIY